jgi:glycolate oxidase FAD binding subunit
MPNTNLHNAVAHLQSCIRHALEARQPLRIQGMSSKQRCLSPFTQTALLSTHELAGVIEYQPSELVIQIGAGTTLATLNEVLASKGQCLPCDPLTLAGKGTVGGAIASALAGGRRVGFGNIRDFVLGLSMVDGRGQLLRFGGQVIKNVAGYDVSRLMCGSWGQMALITEVSFRTLPLPKADLTLTFAVEDTEKIVVKLQQWVGQGLPLAASLIHHQHGWIRLCGHRASVDKACTLIVQALQANVLASVESTQFWQDANAHQIPALATDSLDKGSWIRVAVPPLSPFLWESPTIASLHPTTVEWHGALRWYRATLSAEAWQVLQSEVQARGGAVMVFGEEATSPYPVKMGLTIAEQRLHRAFKQVFDPHSVWY